MTHIFLFGDLIWPLKDLKKPWTDLIVPPLPLVSPPIFGSMLLHHAPNQPQCATYIPPWAPWTFWAKAPTASPCRALDGWMDGCMDGQTYAQIYPVFYRTSSPAYLKTAIGMLNHWWAGQGYCWPCIASGQPVLHRALNRPTLNLKMMFLNPKMTSLSPS